MKILIMHPKNKEQLIALRAVAKALKIRVEISPYDPEFVAMIKKAEKEEITRRSIQMMYGAV